MRMSRADRENHRLRAGELLSILAAERDPRDDAAMSVEQAAEALRFAERSGWREGVALALLQLARRQEPQKAHASLQRALRVFRLLGHAVGQADALNNLALVYRHGGQTTLAVYFLTRAHRLIDDIETAPPSDRALLLLNLAVANFEQSSADTALAIAGEALDLCRRHNLAELLCRTLWMTGRALWRHGLNHLAIHYEREALGFIADAPTWDRAEAEAAFAGAALDAGLEQDAVSHGLHAAELFTHLRAGEDRGIVLLAVGIARLHLNDTGGARDCFEDALAIGETTGSERIRACALRMLGELLIHAGQIHAGIKQAHESLAIGEQHGDQLMQGLACAAIYRGMKQLGDTAAALEYLERALALAQRPERVGSQPRFGDLPVHEELEAVWRRQAIFRMALPGEG